MLLQCPSCEANYQLNVQSIPEGKTHIRCKKCQTPFPLPANAIKPPTKPKIAIQCDHCGAKYRVNASRFTKNVTKVKCTKCGAIFEVQKSENQETTQSTEQAPSTLSEAEKAYFEATTMDGEESGVVPEIKLEFSQADDLFVNPQELSQKQKEKREPPPSKKSTAPEMDFSEEPEFSESLTFSDLADDLETNQDSPKATEPTEGTQWRRKTLLFLLFMGVCVGLAGTGIYLTLQEPAFINYITRSPDLPIRFVGGLSSRRVKNFSSRQTFFVVEGKLQNLLPTSDQMSWIRVKGLAFDDNRKIVETSIVYAGNILNTEELSSWSVDQIKEYSDQKNGRENSNFALQEQQEVSFQIIFFKSAEILQNVTARPISYVRQGEIVYVKTGG